MQELTPREKYMAADPEQFRDDIEEALGGGDMPDDQYQALRDTIAEANLPTKGRMMMVSIDPILRTLPFEARTAVLLNLLVTYAAEEPGVIEHRGKAINALTNDFKMRLQRYLPIKT